MDGYPWHTNVVEFPQHQVIVLKGTEEQVIEADKMAVISSPRLALRIAPPPVATVQRPRRREGTPRGSGIVEVAGVVMEFEVVVVVESVLTDTTN
eukprot:1681249-Amphidinium_carterae.1